MVEEEDDEGELLQAGCSSFQGNKGFKLAKVPQYRANFTAEESLRDAELRGVGRWKGFGLWCRSVSSPSMGS